MNTITLKTGESVILDFDDFERLKNYKWHRVKICRNGTAYTIYAARKENKKSVLMHREIMNVSSGLTVDHKNGDGLDNRKENLRICSHSQNMQNRIARKTPKCRYKGVKMVKSSVNPYLAYLRCGGKFVNLGVHATAERAAMAYNDGARKFFGEFAKVNEIEKN